jgi:predicted dehydrogenase
MVPPRCGWQTAPAFKTMADFKRELEEAVRPDLPLRRNYAIGCVGAGGIMDNAHLPAYRKAGFNPLAISSRDLGKCRAVAARHGITKTYDSWQKLIGNPEIEILDIALPPDVQVEVVREAVKRKNILGILCQKPLAMRLEDAREIAELGRMAGIPIAVNQNMRRDQSMRALKYALDQGWLGEPLLAAIEMRYPLVWQNYMADYQKLEIYGMGIHHIDIFRYLFGEPLKITALCRNDPRRIYAHLDGISQFTFQYENGLIASCLDDIWAGPDAPCEADHFIRWRVEGIDGMARGSIGWADPVPGSSVLELTIKRGPSGWIRPQWETRWFPDAFMETMGALFRAVEAGGESEISAADNVKTVACVEACYASIAEERTVYLDQFVC